MIQTAVEEGLVQRGDRVIRWQPDGGKVLLVRSVFGFGKKKKKSVEGSDRNFSMKHCDSQSPEDNWMQSDFHSQIE